MTRVAPHPTKPVAAATTRPNLLRRVWGAPLWAHAAALLLFLLALLPWMSPNSAFSPDEGAYALQVETLEAGSWAYDYEAARYDPDGRHFPIYLSTRAASGYYPYVKHPAYPLLLQAARRVAGPTLGLHLLALLGTVGTAAAAWLLAAGLDGRLARPAFWMAATGPVVVNGFLIWAHAPSAALAGLALVGAVKIARRGFSPLATVGVSTALVAGVLLRSEALLFALGLAAALAWARLRRATGLRRLVPLLLAVPPVIAALLEHAWIGAIIGEGLEAAGIRRGRVPFLQGRLSGLVHELLGPAELEKGAALPVLVALVLVVGLGYLGLRRWGPRSCRSLAVATAGSGLALLVRVVVYPYEPVTGLFAAWPLGLLGLLLVRWGRGGTAAAQLGLTVALFTGAVLLLQYPEGGATEWGGRFLSPVLAPLAALATAGLATALQAVPRPERRLATGLVATVAIVFAAFGLVTVGSERARIERVTRAIARHPAPVTVTTQTFVPRAGWSADRTLAWMQADEHDLAPLVAQLGAKGVPQVAVVVPDDVPVSRLTGLADVREVREPAIRAVGMRLFLVKPLAS
jgi:hypothetical protein